MNLIQVQRQLESWPLLLIFFFFLFSKTISRLPLVTFFLLLQMHDV